MAANKRALGLASLQQLEPQMRDEERRIREAYENRTFVPVGTDFYQLAYDEVKKRWVEQGIWNDKWTATASGAVWKHEQPLELESELETETETEAKKKPPIFSFSQNDPRPNPRQPKSDEEKRLITERRAAQERERQASRPFHQFVY